MAWKVSAEVARYEEALAWFDKRVPGIDTGAAEDRARGTAFRVAGMLQLDAVQTVFDELRSAIDKGTPIADFRKRVREKLGALAPNGFHLETVFRNWLQKSYNRGRVAQMREPSTAKFRPYWMYDAILDSRTTEICKLCHGVIKLHDDPWWQNRVPPLHHNAVLSGTDITTDRGKVPVDSIEPGDLVLTHAGRFQRVTAVLSKLVTNRPVRELHTASGRRLVVTHEHPVLVSGPLRWEVSGDLEIGHKLFQHVDELPRPECVPVCDPQYAPPLAHEPAVSSGIRSAPVRARMAVPVDLNRNHTSGECDIENVATDRVLCDGPSGAKEVEQIGFLRGKFLAVSSCPGDGRSRHHFVDTGWVHGSHAASMGIDSLVSVGPEPVGPVVLAGSLCDNGRVGICDGDLLASASEPDSMDGAPAPNDAVASPVFALERAHASSVAPVLSLDESLELGLTAEVHWSSDSISSIVESRYDGLLFDLSVEADESYVANGIIVHNCRSSIRNLRASEAVKRGITEDDPAANEQPKGSFGRIDDDSAEYPDVGKIDPAVLAVLRRKQAEAAEELRQADEAARIRRIGGLVIDDSKIQAEMAAAKDLAVKVLDSGAPVGGSERERHDRAMDIVHSKLGTISANHHWAGFETGHLCWYDSSTGPKNTIGHWLTRDPRQGEAEAVKQQTGYKGSADDLVKMTRNQYAATQSMLAKRIARGEMPMVDKDGFVMLYRGIRDEQADAIRADVKKPVNEPIKVLVRSVSSWSASEQVARDFAEAGGVVVHQKVHVSRVFSQWEQGKASTLKYHDELEWILVYPEEAVVIPKGDVILL